MTNIITRRLLNRNLLKLKEFTQVYKPHSCASLIFLNVDHNTSPTFITSSHQHQSLYCFSNSHLRFYSDQCKKGDVSKEQKLSLFQKFKKMYKDYWYVLVPVHLVTSAAWFGGFYYLAKSGVDIAALLESWHVSETITNTFRDSSMGYLAVAYALYKIATPARYTVTLGGTTISINYLKKWGYIKPVPSAERLKEIYLEKKDNLLETMKDTREGLKMQSEKFKDKQEKVIDDIDNSIKHMKKIGNNIKNKEKTIVKELKKEVEKKSKA